MNVMSVAVLLSFVALAASSCDGAEPGGKVPSDQQVAFESYRRAWAAERPRIEADIDANRKARDRAMSKSSRKPGCSRTARRSN